MAEFTTPAFEQIGSKTSPGLIILWSIKCVQRKIAILFRVSLASANKQKQKKYIYIQLFRERLSEKSTKVHATIAKGSLGHN